MRFKIFKCNYKITIQVCVDNVCSHDSSAHQRHVTSVMRENGFDTTCDEEMEHNNEIQQEKEVLYYNEPYHYDTENWPEQNATAVRRTLLVQSPPKAESRKFINSIGMRFGVFLSGDAGALFGADGPLTVSWSTFLSYTLNSNSFSFGISIS